MLELCLRVPQGLVLSPLIFLDCINDVVSCVEEFVRVQLFADDLVVYTIVYYSDDHNLLNAF